MAAARRDPKLEQSLEEWLDASSRVPHNDVVPDSSDSGDLENEIPAAVVCVRCGDPECAGCEESDLSRSGIVAIVAWERPTTPALTRLWATARSSTRDAEAFFELMPDGPLLPALRFAATCELLASGAAFLGFLAVAAVVAPEWLRHVALDPDARSVALRALVLGLPAFAGLLVVAHAAHGLAIDAGARKQGARPARSRALRFGLYACGWDLVMGPIGAVVVAIKEGIRPALDLAGALSGLPTRATNAFLRGCYRLDGDRAKKALGTSYVGATVATLVFAALVLFAIVALALA